MAKKKKISKAEARDAVHPMRDEVASINPKALFADGFDDCIIGVADRFGIDSVAAYDYDNYKGWYFELGVSHDFPIENTGITLTTALTKAHDSGAQIASDLPTPGAPNKYSRRRN